MDTKAIQGTETMKGPFCKSSSTMAHKQRIRRNRTARLQGAISQTDRLFSSADSTPGDHALYHHYKRRTNSFELHFLPFRSQPQPHPLDAALQGRAPSLGTALAHLLLLLPIRWRTQ